MFTRTPVGGLETRVLDRFAFSPELQTRPEPGAVPDAFETVVERLQTADRIESPDDTLDLRGLEPQQRVGRVRNAFEGLDSDESLYVVSDRDPTPVGEFLTDLVGADEDPTDVLPEFTVERRGLDEWALEAVHP